MTDPKKRAKCLAKSDACQALVVDEAARILARSVYKCGGELGALVRYNTGSCSGYSRYQTSVMRTRAKLRGLAGLEGEA